MEPRFGADFSDVRVHTDESSGRLNDALGATSIVVTHDVEASFKIVDYVYFVSAGRVVAEGTPASLSRSTEPFVQQFVRGETDGPVPFHYPAQNYADDLGVERHP
jgi:phospholipid/cholesterol/gamma-HCH transport system ATP-binding protein